MSKTIAVDFDGTITLNNTYPYIGEPNPTVVYALRRAQRHGDKIILWTCRCGKYLQEAVDWCESEGLVFDAVNENLQEHIDKFGEDPRKIHADEYWDDKNFNIDYVLI